MILNTLFALNYYIIVNSCINERYNRNIYINKLIPDVTEQRAEIVNLIDWKRMN